jgi:predicted dehydrogenase
MNMLERQVHIMKLGIVGSGGIVHVALDSLAKIDEIQVEALWCRKKSEEKGMELCKKYGIPALFCDYEEFLADPNFDTVYIGLVNSAHYEYALQALQAGKNVICEKPLTLTPMQSRKLIDTAKEKGLFLFEAIMSRYSDNFEALKENLDKIGKIKLVESRYCQYSSRYDAYRQGKVLPAFDVELGGGSLYDINLYCVQLIMGLFGKPESVQYLANIGFNGIDTSGILAMDYGDFKAMAVGAKDCAGMSKTFLQGEDGTIEIDSTPGRLENMVLKRKNQPDVMLDAAPLNDPMETELRKIEKVVAANDYDTCYKWIETSHDVMQALYDGRKSAGIIFPADTMEI